MKTLLLTLVFGVMVAGCGGQRSAPVENPGATPENSATGFEIAVIPKALSGDLWQTVKAGAEAAAKETGTKMTWNAPSKENDAAEQATLLKDLIARKPGAIVIAACDSDGLTGGIEAAVAAGIPVITMDSPVASEAPAAFVGTDNVAGAQEAARALARLIDEDGRVAMLPFTPGAPASAMREEGFVKGVKEFPRVRLTATLYSYNNLDKAVKATRDILAANPALKGIFAANDTSAAGAAQAVAAAGKAGAIKIVAFDASPEELNALKEGAIQTLIVQHPFQMGYLSVKTAVDAVNKRPVTKSIDTGVTLVTKDNLETPDIQKLLTPTK